MHPEDRLQRASLLAFCKKDESLAEVRSQWMGRRWGLSEKGFMGETALCGGYEVKNAVEGVGNVVLKSYIRVC